MAAAADVTAPTTLWGGEGAAMGGDGACAVAGRDCACALRGRRARQAGKHLRLRMRNSARRRVAGGAGSFAHAREEQEVRRFSRPSGTAGASVGTFVGQRFGTRPHPRGVGRAALLGEHSLDFYSSVNATLQ
ncbi:ubiquitin-conjugating enzyme E2 B isoform X2 [Numida meleagris]|uniref:ubiquitin-conjugating enzyme E2 B isoform X2 n=1 Tax=Numida meleagris TaxID=8996 RepID=UPI000B3E2A8D|nr:ubiquitin-conjugating enzyme E2 B isoform X2 [Numida meleagris]